ncbi:MAG: alpha-hydroxy-acid oxidizing protein [Oscillospiraceae bacterium]|nr:alpha-hydroxy-acid oxidizing protein [Oscillospiraceae bacterium]
MEHNARAGDSNLITRSYFDSLLIELRHFDSVLPDTSLKLYGESFDTPVMMAALSHLDKHRGDGMAEMARGAKAANAVMWAGMGSEAELERITATGAKTIKIVKPSVDNNEILRNIAHAERCGCIAVGMDIDHAFGRNGRYDVVFGEHMSGKTFAEVKEFVSATKLPFIIKGVLSVQDAQKCIEAGVRGIVVSHHHGTIDFAVPPLMILPDIVKAIGGRMPIFVDCGVESGHDAFKALALGATAVSAGRAVIGPLSENGADGVHRLIQDMTAQLAGMMAKTCSHDIAKIDPAVIWNTSGFNIGRNL